MIVSSGAAADVVLSAAKDLLWEEAKTQALRCVQDDGNDGVGVTQRRLMPSRAKPLGSDVSRPVATACEYVHRCARIWAAG